MSAQDCLVATLAKHSLEDYQPAGSWGSSLRESWVWCACGVSITADGSPAQLHAAHVAAVIAGADDLAVVEIKAHPDVILDCSNDEAWVHTGNGGDRDYATVDGEYGRSFDAVMKLTHGGGAVALARVPWAAEAVDRG